MAEPTNATHVPILEYADFASQILGERNLDGGFRSGFLGLHALLLRSWQIVAVQNSSVQSVRRTGTCARFA